MTLREQTGGGGGDRVISGGSKTVFGEALYGMFSPPLSSPLLFSQTNPALGTFLTSDVGLVKADHSASPSKLEVCRQLLHEVNHHQSQNILISRRIHLNSVELVVSGEYHYEGVSPDTVCWTRLRNTRLLSREGRTFPMNYVRNS